MGDTHQGSAPGPHWGTQTGSTNHILLGNQSKQKYSLLVGWRCSSKCVFTCSCRISLDSNSQSHTGQTLHISSKSAASADDTCDCPAPLFHRHRNTTDANNFLQLNCHKYTPHCFAVHDQSIHSCFNSNTHYRPFRTVTQSGWQQDGKLTCKKSYFNNHKVHSSGTWPNPD